MFDVFNKDIAVDKTSIFNMQSLPINSKKVGAGSN
jgi:hypothetical protein